jgi:hypothetical protein
MSRTDVRRVSMSLLFALALVSCSDDGNSPSVAHDSGSPGSLPDDNDAGRDAGAVVDATRPVDMDAALDASAVDAAMPALARTGCLDRPGALPVAPSGPLSCELLPPGLTL